MRRVDEGGGRAHLDHRFALGGTHGLLRQAVSVRLHDWQLRRLTVVLTPGMLGHAFPTGDLFRRAELRVWLGASANSSTPPDAVYALERRYRYEREGMTRRVAFDTRLPAPSQTNDGSRTVELTLSRPASLVSWKLVWQRMPVDAATPIGLDARNYEVTVAEGQWSKPKPPTTSPR